MFERFTDRAREVVVTAQREARQLNHNYIGTEHLLLGLLGEPRSLAHRALVHAGVSTDRARQEIIDIVGMGKGKTPGGHIPFTPRAKKVLELSLREALNFGHNYIGTEHILLGLVREGDGVAATVLHNQGVDLKALRDAVVALLPPGEPAEARLMRRWLRRRGAPSAPDEPRTTTATDASLDEARRLAGNAAVGSHHLLLATLSDPTSAAAKALGNLGIDLERAREALRDVDVTGTTDELPEEAGRRQLLMTLTDRGLTLETTDPTLLAQARAALDALGPGEGEPATLRGDHPRATGFADVWQAWSLALQQITNLSTPDEPPAA